MRAFFSLALLLVVPGLARSETWPQFRGATGDGVSPETKLPDIISDIEFAFQWIAGEGGNRFHLDSDKVVVCGGSAGVLRIPPAGGEEVRIRKIPGPG